MAACLAFLASQIGARGERSAARSGQRLRPLRRRLLRGGPDAARALIVFYRSIYLANDSRRSRR